MRHALIAAMTVSALLLVAPNARAAGEGGGGAGGGGGGSGAATPSRAPIGAPPPANSDAINNAYEFRNRLSSDPVCQELARQSDATYSNAELKNDKKQQSLEQIRNRAKAAGCF